MVNDTFLLYAIAVITTVFLIQIYIDPMIRECKSKLGILLIVSHHFLNITIVFGSLLFGHRVYHLILLIGALVVHKMSGICPLTKIHNQLCGINENKPLITILNRIVPNYPNNTKTVIMLYYVILITIITYDIVFITRK